VAERQYPADPAYGALRLFGRWLGARYARSTSLTPPEGAEDVLQGTIVVGRRWSLAVGVVNTLAPDADLGWEAARAAIEQRLDAHGHSVLVWAPRRAQLPSAEPGLSEIMRSLDAANALPDGRLELRRPVNLYLRRTAMNGSVITVLGGLSAHWAQFTSRVPGSFQLNSDELLRLPSSPEEREALAERIVLAAQQPDVDDSLTIPAEDAWTANTLEDGGSCVLGTPKPENDEWSSSLRRNLRALLRKAAPMLASPADARALVVLGASTYAEEEKLSWALRGMDPSLYAGYDILAVVTDGLVKPILQPGRGALPWDEG
jgi:hypothetical protein